MNDLRPGRGRALLFALVVVAAMVGGAHLASVTVDRAPAGDSFAAAVVPAASSARVVVHSEVIGYSVQHRPIVAYELGDPHATFTAVVLGSTHGYYERAGETVTRALRTTTIPRGLHLWVIDTINPDGDALHQRGNAHGVDLNRNWPYRWIPISRSGCTAFSCHYSGPGALSEPESAAMTRFLKKIKPNRVVSIHQPLDGVDTTDGGARDPAFRDALARNLNLPRKAFTCFGGCHGSMTGWLTHATSTTGIVVEFPQVVAASQLSGPAARGILSALMVGVRVPARPNVSRVAGLSGATGSLAGGNTVTLIGTGFTTAWKVTFGGVPGTRLKVLSAGRITVVAPSHAAGPVSVRVTGVGGTSTATTRSHYTFVAPPAVKSVAGTSGATGTTGGGNTVTIAGSGFAGVSRVTFGGVSGTAIRRLSATRLTVVAPKHAAGLVGIQVTGIYGRSATVVAGRYTFVAPPAVKTVAGTSGATGTTGGGNTVTIAGSGFAGVSRVTFGGVSGTAIRRLSATKLTVVAPRHAAGLVGVQVTGTYGRSAAVTAARYTYVGPPAIGAVSPKSGATTGGNTVTITGSGFTGISTVTFGGVSGSAMRRLSATKLTVVAPRHAAGLVGIQLTGTYGGSASVTAGRYTYADLTAPAPVTDVLVTDVAPESVTLSWTNPADADLAGVLIRRATGPTPPSSPTGGTLVVDVAAGVHTFSDRDLEPETTYSYALFSHDAAHNFAASAAVTVTTAPVAASPVDDGGGTADDGGGSADDGGGTADDGGASGHDGGGSADDGGASGHDGGGSADDGGASGHDGGGSADDGGGSADDGGGS